MYGTDSGKPGGKVAKNGDTGYFPLIDKALISREKCFGADRHGDSRASNLRRPRNLEAARNVKTTLLEIAVLVTQSEQSALMESLWRKLSVRVRHIERAALS